MIKQVFLWNGPNAFSDSYGRRKRAYRPPLEYVGPPLRRKNGVWTDPVMGCTPSGGQTIAFGIGMVVKNGIETPSGMCWVLSGRG